MSSTAGLPWIEIDFPQDLHAAETEILPRIEAIGPKAPDHSPSPPARRETSRQAPPARSRQLDRPRHLGRLVLDPPKAFVVERATRPVQEPERALDEALQPERRRRNRPQPFLLEPLPQPRRHRHPGIGEQVRRPHGTAFPHRPPRHPDAGRQRLAEPPLGPARTGGRDATQAP